MYIHICMYMHRFVGADRENKFATRFQLRQVIAMRWKHGGSSWFFATFIMACSLGQCRGSWATLSGLRGTDPNRRTLSEHSRSTSDARPNRGKKLAGMGTGPWWMAFKSDAAFWAPRRLHADTPCTQSSTGQPPTYNIRQNYSCGSTKSNKSMSVNVSHILLVS